jgi:hypothetical protein
MANGASCRAPNGAELPPGLSEVPVCMVRQRGPLVMGSDLIFAWVKVRFCHESLGFALNAGRLDRLGHKSCFSGGQKLRALIEF